VFWFHVICLPVLALAAAYITTYFGRRRHEAKTLKKAELQRRYVPDFRYYILLFKFEALWRTFYLNLAFAGVSVGVVTTGYVSQQVGDIWFNPLLAAAACVAAGIVSQIGVRDDVIDWMSARGIRRVVFWGIVFIATFAYSVFLSDRHSGNDNDPTKNGPTPTENGQRDAKD